MSQDKKEIKKVVTELVSVPVTFQLVARWPRLEMKEPVDVVWSMRMSVTQQLCSFKPKSQKLFKLGLPFLTFGHLINYLLTEFSFRTVRY